MAIEPTTHHLHQFGAFSPEVALVVPLSEVCTWPLARAKYSGSIFGSISLCDPGVFLHRPILGVVIQQSPDFCFPDSPALSFIPHMPPLNQSHVSLSLLLPGLSLLALKKNCLMEISGPYLGHQWYFYISRTELCLLALLPIIFLSQQMATSQLAVMFHVREETGFCLGVTIYSLKAK